MSITKDFSNDLWYEAISGTGTITVQDSGASILISSPSGSSARSRYYTTAFPGEKLTFTCWARNIPDGLDGFAGIWIDIPIGTLTNVQEVMSEDLQVYTVSGVVPYHLIGPQKVAFGVGSFGALDGSAEFINPVITRSGSHVVMEGFFECPIAGATLPFLRADYLNYNVGAITWNATNQTVIIDPSVVYDFQETGGTNQFRPLLLMSGAPDGNTTEVYSWTGSCTGFDANISIQAASLTTNSPVDLQGVIGVKRFFGFRLLMVGDG